MDDSAMSVIRIGTNQRCADFVGNMLNSKLHHGTECALGYAHLVTPAIGSPFEGRKVVHRYGSFHRMSMAGPFSVSNRRTRMPQPSHR